MDNTRSIEELIKQSKKNKNTISLDNVDKHEDVTRLLEEDEIKDYNDFTKNSIEKISETTNLDDFDYFKEETVEEEEEKQVADISEEISPVEKMNVVDVQDLSVLDIETLDTKLIDTVELEEISEDEQDDIIEKIMSEISSSGHLHSDSEKAIIEFKDIKLTIADLEIIKGVDLKIYPGEFVYVVGPSGAGKSSLVSMVYKDVISSGGNLIVDDTEVTTLKSKKLPKLRRKIGVIFQDYKLLNNKTVYQNVMYSLEVTGYLKKARHEQVLKTLKTVGILDKKDKYPNELSGGQQQRVAIARAIVGDPKIIVADEPTGNLDPKNAIIIMEILKRINESGTTILMATHDVGIVNKYKNRVVLVKDGKVANESEGVYIYE